MLHFFEKIRKIREDPYEISYRRGVVLPVLRGVPFPEGCDSICGVAVTVQSEADAELRVNFRPISVTCTVTGTPITGFYEEILKSRVIRSNPSTTSVPTYKKKWPV